MIKCLATIGVVILAWILAWILGWILGGIVCATVDEFFKEHTEIAILAFAVGFAIALPIGIVIF